MVKVVSCALLGESQVGGEVVGAVSHGLLLLMQSTLCTKEVTLGDEGVHVASCSMKSGLVEVLGLSIIPSKYVSGRNKRTYTKCTLTDVEDGSMITQMWNKEIAQLVPILVGFSHLRK